MAWAVTLIQISKGDFYTQPSKISQNFNVMESKNMLKCFNYDYSEAFLKSVLFAILHTVCTTKVEDVC